MISLFNNLIIDSFAGGGGASTGIELELGRPVDIAINHDVDAILMHKTNHPATRHYCESVWDIDPVAITNGREVDLLWGSPDCKHFSKAKGGKPVDKNIRGLAWVLVEWARKVHPRVIIMENVAEFKTWGPLTEDGYPDKEKSGETFREFVAGLKECGYAVEHKELIACDFGAPTIRKRFFLVARCDGQPIVFPKPTHGNPQSAAIKEKKLKPWRTAAEIIDWTLPCPSIFDRKKPLAENTLKRIAKGIKKFVIDNPKPFILPIQFNNDPKGTDEPLPTQCAVAKDYIVNPTIIPIGYGEREGQEPRVNDSRTPLSTVVSSTKQYVITPIVSNMQFGNAGHTADKPTQTATTGNKDYVVSPLCVQLGHTGFSEERASDVKEPIRTVVTKNEQCIVTPIITQYHSYKGDDARGQKVTDPLLTLDTSNRYALTTAFLAKHFGGSYKGSGSAVDKPAPTVTTVDHTAVATAFIMQQFNTSTGHKADVPMNAVTAVNFVKETGKLETIEQKANELAHIMDVLKYDVECKRITPEQYQELIEYAVELL